jgi:MFS family permease
MMTNRKNSLPSPPVQGPATSASIVPGFYGWRVVAAAFTVAVFGWGTGLYGAPVYLEVVRQSRGWPIGLISGAMTLHFLVGLAFIPNLPALYRRFGLPTVTVVGGVVMAIGLLGWALASAPWQLYVAALSSGAEWSILGAVAVNAIVCPWFAAKRPLALGVAFNGGSVGGVIFSPLWVALIGAIGFPPAALVVSVAMLATLATLAGFVLTRTPENLHQAPDGDAFVAPASLVDVPADTTAPTPRLNLFRDHAFLTLCTGMTLALFAQTGLVAHLVSVLTPELGRQGAGLAAGASGLAAVVGRLVVGWPATGSTNWRVIASYSLVAQALGCGVLLLSHESSSTLLVLGVVLFGLGVGNASSVPPVIANLEFAGRDAVRAVASIVAISQGAYAIAPTVFGLFRQFWSDQTVFVTAIVIQLAAIFAYLLGHRSRAAAKHFRALQARPGAA